MMQAMGRAVETFAGQYMIAEDVGTIVEDMNNISKETKHVVGTSTGHSSSGDPSPTTAYGIYVGLKSAVRYRLNKDDLKDVRVAVQGLGNVGYNLCKLLHNDGAVLTVTDMDPAKVERANQEFGATSAALKDIYDVEADVFSPCALGAILNDENIDRLNVSVVAGAANNQLAEDRHGDMLKDKGILYAPDYVINAGGLIGVYFETQARMQDIDFDLAKVRAQVDQIDATSQKIFKKAEQENIPTSVAADRIAEERFKKSASCMAA